jgi:hypothetical protein
MKPLPLLFTASLLMIASSALAQEDACSNRYGSCMDRCSSRPAETQAGCMNSCQSQSDECYQGLWGQVPADKSAVAAGKPSDVDAAKAEPSR